MKGFFKAWVLCIAVILCCSLSAYSQNGNRVKSFAEVRDTIVVDTLSIVPGTVLLGFDDGTLPDTADYSVDLAGARIFFSHPEHYIGKTLLISYRVLPFLLSEKKFRKDIRVLRPDKELMADPFRYEISDRTKQELFPLKGLDKSGNISRGISFGNSQDVVVNSSMNLQLAGPVGGGLNILAAISDQNMPIQPDGTTQQLQDFDKVFIKLYNENNSLIAGDFELSRPEKGYFMNLNKKLQGLSFATIAGIKKKDDQWGTVSVQTAGAVSKGKYARNTIAGMEGNQGPYKLRGNNNESYIVILAGTEKVFIDGQMLTRGLENDYIIDYNTAEISFTPNQPVTKDKRIVVEFEYSEKNYTRSSLYGSVVMKDKLQKVAVWVNMYSEQDAKSQPIQDPLSDEEKDFMQDMGDNTSRAWYPGVDSAGFSADEIRYLMTDSLVDGLLHDSVFIYSTDPELAMYRLVFAFVGQGNGNYRQITSAANGRVFEWLAPVSGMRQGSYEPVRLIPAPTKKQLVTAGVSGMIGKKITAFVETAVSNADKNLFSDIDDGDNQGYSAKTALEFKTPVGSDSLLFFSGIDYQVIQGRFQPIERFRGVEHTRDWNLGNNRAEAEEHSGGLWMGIKDKTGRQLRYDLSGMLYGYDYQGIMNSVAVNWRFNRLSIDYSGKYLGTSEPDFSTTFLRQYGRLAYRIGIFTTGVKAETEDNRFNTNTSDSLMGNSAGFYYGEAFLSTADTSKTTVGMSFRRRFDLLPNAGALKEASMADDIAAELRFSGNPDHRFSLKTIYRRMEVLDTLMYAVDNENTILSRAEYSLNLLKRAISTNVFYEAGSGMDMKKNVSYIEVAAGQGLYAWTDYNGNGVKELDEFDVAAFRDQASFIRVFTPSTEYERVYSNTFQGLLQLDPSRVWKKSTGIRKFAGRFSNRTVYRIDRKTKVDNLVEAYNPFAGIGFDSNLVSLNGSFRNAVYFNKVSPKFGADFTFQESRNLTSLLYGADSRFQNNKSIDFRWNITRKLMMNGNVEEGIRRNSSLMFSTRNYSILSHKAGPALTVQTSTRFRMKVLYAYSEKKNRTGEKEYAVSHRAGTEWKYSIPSKGALQLQLDYIYIDFNGNTNSPVGYEMTEGLSNGRNITWYLTYQRNIAGNLQMMIGYEGRKPGDLKTVHIGSVQLRAFF
ncbi:MAG: hypothetical protein KKD31_05340 [Bacteroidetes bacterium]|nr:hypothetical protein [Bacteroidota bacterium]